MEDIRTRADIEMLVSAFYKKAMTDFKIGQFFTEVVELNLELHLPVICDFWETVLLDNVVYRGNPMVKHLALSEKRTLRPQHFDRWLMLWSATINASYEGPKADLAINRAKQIAGLMQHKISQKGL